MRCERVQFMYDEYTQGSLAVPTMARVEEHLVGCPTCREFFEQSDMIARLMRRSSEVAHPGPNYFEALNTRVLKALDEPAARQPARDPAPILRIPTAQWRRPLWWIGSAAAAALLLLGLLPQPDDSGRAGRLTAAAHPRPASLFLANRLASQLARTPAASTNPQNHLPSPEYRELTIAALDNPKGALAALASGTTLDKGVAGKRLNSALVEQIIDAAGQSQADQQRSYGERRSLSEVERQASQETEKRMVSLENKAARRDTLPTEVFAQLQVLKTQLVAGGNEALRKNLSQLEQTVGERVAGQAELNSLPIVKQAKLYLEAEALLEDGHLDEALQRYMRIQFVDRTTPLALRSALQIADLFYSECANFREAEAYYLRCQGSSTEEAFTTAERTHIARQVDRLVRYKDGNWQALDLLDKVHRGNWPEVPGALRSLIALPETAPLLPEASRTILERMDGTSKLPAADVTMDLYNLLAKQAEVEQNGEARAWLELTVGDLAVSQFRDPQQALNRYRRVAASADASGAAKLARVKLDKLLEFQLTESVRNRK